MAWHPWHREGFSQKGGLRALCVYTRCPLARSPCHEFPVFLQFLSQILKRGPQPHVSVLSAATIARDLRVVPRCALESEAARQLTSRWRRIICPRNIREHAVWQSGSYTFFTEQPDSYTPTFWSLPGSVSQIGLTNRTSESFSKAMSNP